MIIELKHNGANCGECRLIRQSASGFECALFEFPIDIDSDENLYRCEPCIDEGGHPENTLIAAAPDMLDALKEIYGWFDMDENDQPKKKIREIIARAEGRE